MFENLLQKIKVGIIIHAPDTAITFSNPEAARLLGVSEKQMQGLESFNDAWHFVREDGSILPLEEYPVKLVLASLKPLDEYVAGIYRPGTGNRVWVLVNAYPEFGENHELQHIVVTLIEITRHKQVEEALIKSEKKFRHLFETMKQGVVYQAENGHIISANPAAESILGLTLDQLMGKTSMDPNWKAIREDGSELSGHEHPAMVALRTGKSVESFIMGVMKQSQNSHTWISVNAIPLFRTGETKPFQVYATLEDITAQRHAKEELLQEKLLTNALMDSLPGIFYLYSYPELRLVRWNKNHETLLGFDSVEIKNRSIFDWHPPEAKEAILHAIKMVMEKGKNTIESSLLTKDGRSIPFIMAGVKLEYSRQTYLMGIGIDIADRLRADQELKESEERFKALHNASFGGICIHDKGIIIDCNQGLSAMTGYSPDELIGMNGLQLIAPDSRELVMSNIVAGFEKPYEALGMRKSGETFPMRLEARNIPYKGKKVRTVEFRDITDSKKAAEALQESEATIKKKLQTILDPEGDIGNLNLSDIIDQEALQMMMEEFYQLTHISGAILDTYGKVLVAFGWQEICTKFHRVHPETQKNCLESDVNLASGVPVGTFKAYKCKNNMWDMVTPIEIGGKHLGNFYLGQFFFDDEIPDLELFRSQCHHYGFNEAEYLEALARVPYMSRETINTAIAFCGKLTGMISSLSYSKIKIARALSQKDIALGKLCESEEKLNALFASMTEMVALHEVVLNEQGEAINYRIIDCNDAFSKITGIKKEDAIGRLATEVYQAESAPYLKEYAEVGISRHPFKYTTYYAPMNKHFSISVISPKQNQFATVTTDITAIKQIQEAITSKNKELESYLYIASHDLRSPLVNIQGFSQRLQKQVNSIIAILDDCKLLDEARSSIDSIANDGVPKTLNYIFSNVKKMDALLNGLLQVSRMGRATMSIKKMNMNSLIKAIITEHNFQITEISAKVAIQELPDCYGDENLLNQLFSNIIGNAIKYRDGSRQLSIEITALAEFDKVVYCIKDNGMGIEERYLDKIWNVFYQIDPSVTGSGEGLGLSVVKKVAEKHNGKVWVESESGKGSAFYIELPTTDFHE